MKKILSLILSVMMLPICNTYAEDAQTVRIAGRLLYSEDFDAENGFEASDKFETATDGERSVMKFALGSSGDMLSLAGTDAKNVITEYDFKLTEGKSKTNNSFFLTLRANEVSGSGVRFGYHEITKYENGGFSGSAAYDKISVGYSTDGDANVTKESWVIGGMSDSLGICGTRAFDKYYTFRNSVHNNTAYTQIFAQDKTEKARLCADFSDLTMNDSGKLYFGAHNTEGYIDSLKVYEMLDVAAISIEADNMELKNGESTSFNIRVSENGTDWISLPKSKNADFTYSYNEEELAVDAENGTITALADGNLALTITAKDFYEDETFSDTFVFKGMTDREAAEEARDALVMDVTMAEADFELPVSGLYNTTVSWSSDKGNIVISGNKATVIKAEEDAVVTLTATITRGEESVKRIFTVTVPGIEKAERDIILKGDLVFEETFDDEAKVNSDIKALFSEGYFNLSDGALYINATTADKNYNPCIYGPFGNEIKECIAEYDMKQLKCSASSTGHIMLGLGTQGTDSYRFVYSDISKFNPATNAMDNTSSVRDRLIIGYYGGSALMDNKWTYFAGSSQATGALMTNGRVFEDFYTFSAALAGNTAVFSITSKEEDVLDVIAAKNSSITPRMGNLSIGMQNTECLIDNLKVYEAIGFDSIKLVPEKTIAEPGEAIGFDIILSNGEKLDKKYFDKIEIIADSSVAVDKENCKLTFSDEGSVPVRVIARDMSDPDVKAEGVTFVSVSESAGKLIEITNSLKIEEIVEYPDALTKDFTLPIQKDGATISWSSDSPVVVIEGANAVVTRGNSDTEVKLTANIEIDGVKSEKQFKVIVSKDYSGEEIIEKDRKTIEIPERTTDDITLPESGRFGSTIVWSSDDTDVISVRGIVTRQEKTKTVTLTAVFTANGVEKTVYYNVTVPGKKTSGGGGGGGGGSSYGGGSSSTSVSVIAPTITAPVEFTFRDVKKDFWAADKIYALLDKDVIAEAEDFRPNDNIKREEFVKMAVEMFGILDENAVCSFADCDENMWYYKYVASAYSAGIVGGKDDGSFGVGELITREDMAAIIARILEAKGKGVDTAELNFADSDEISEYAKKAVAGLSKAGVINGMGDNTFAPKNNATRAQCAVILYQAEKL